VDLRSGKTQKEKGGGRTVRKRNRRTIRHGGGGGSRGGVPLGKEDKEREKKGSSAEETGALGRIIMGELDHRGKNEGQVTGKNDSRL